MINTLSIMRLESLTELNETICSATMLTQVKDVRNLINAYKELKAKSNIKEDWDRAFPAIEILRNT